MAEHTVRLVAQDADPSYPTAGGSGFLLQRDGAITIITAGHNFDLPGHWHLETSVVVENRVLLIPIGSVTRLARVDLASGEEAVIDIAWARVREEDVQPRAGRPTAPNGIQLPVYRGPIEHPQDDELYGFAAWSRVEVDDNLQVAFRDRSFEVGMEFEGRDEESGLYCFSLARKHQGDLFYQGASGAPIADRTGKIVSVVLAGDEESDLLFGAPLADYSELIDLEL